MVQGASGGLGLQSVSRDVEVHGGVTIESDAAAISIASRRRQENARHVEVRQLWLQEEVRRGSLR